MFRRRRKKSDRNNSTNSETTVLNVNQLKLNKRILIGNKIEDKQKANNVYYLSNNDTTKSVNRVYTLSIIGSEILEHKMYTTTRNSRIIK